MNLIDVLRRMFLSGIENTEEQLRRLREEKCDLNKELITEKDKYLKSIRNVVRELERMLKSK